MHDTGNENVANPGDQGVTAAVITTLQNTRGGYVGADATQQSTDQQKLQAHVEVETAFASATVERVDLQLAADQIWTYHNPANSAVRRAFKIPPDRPATE